MSSIYFHPVSFSGPPCILALTWTPQIPHTHTMTSSQSHGPSQHPGDVPPFSVSPRTYQNLTPADPEPVPDSTPPSTDVSLTTPSLDALAKLIAAPTDLETTARPTPGQERPA